MYCRWLFVFKTKMLYTQVILFSLIDTCHTDLVIIKHMYAYTVYFITTLNVVMAFLKSRFGKITKRSCVYLVVNFNNWFCSVFHLIKDRLNILVTKTVWTLAIKCLCLSTALKKSSTRGLFVSNHMNVGVTRYANTICKSPSWRKNIKISHRGDERVNIRCRRRLSYLALQSSL